MVSPNSGNKGASYLRGFIAVTVIVVVLAMYPFTPQPTYDIKRLVVQIGAFLMVAGWAGSLGASGPGRMSIVRILWIALLALNAAAVAFSDYPAYSLGAFTWLLTLFLIYFVASRAYTTPEASDRLAVVACLAVALSTAYAACQFFGWDPFPWNPEYYTQEVYRRLPGTFGNPNVAGHTLVLALILSVYLALEKRRRLFLILTAAFAAHSYVTGHRAGLLALAAAAAAVGLAEVLRRKVASPRRALAGFAVALAVPALLVVALAGAGFLRGILPLDSSLLLRYNSFYGAAQMILDRPLLGFGPGTFVIENTPYWTDLEQEHFARERRLNDHPHSEPLDMAVGAGLASGALYLALLATPLILAAGIAFRTDDARTRRGALAFVAFFTAFLVDGAFGFNLRSPVSGLLMALFLGAFDGMYLRPTEPAPVSAPAETPRWVPVATLLVLAFVGLTWGVRTFAAQIYMQRGAAALHWKAYDLALEELARGAALAPWDWMFDARRGQALLAKGELDDARDYFRAALDRNPYHLPSLVQAARVSLAQAASGDAAALSESEAYAAEALRLCPGLAQAHAHAGRLALLRAMRLPVGPQVAPERAKEIDSARKSFRRALAEGAENRSELHALLAQAALMKGEVDEGESQLARAVESDPTNDAAWDAFATFAEQTRRFDVLRASLERTVARPAGSGERDIARRAALYALLARVEAQTGRTDRAVEWFRRAARTEPDRADTWSRFWAYARKNGQEDAFRETVRQVLDDRRRNAPAPPETLRAAQAVWRGTPQDLERAAVILADASKKYEGPDTRERLAADLGWAVELGWTEARQAPYADKLTPRALWHWGLVLYRMGALEEAVRAFTRAEEAGALPAERIACAQGKAQALEELGRFDAAEAVLTRALAEAPDNADLRFARVRVLAKSGERARARRECADLLKAPDLDPGLRQAIEEQYAKLQAPPAP